MRSAEDGFIAKNVRQRYQGIPAIIDVHAGVRGLTGYRDRHFALVHDGFAAVARRHADGTNLSHIFGAYGPSGGQAESRCRPWRDDASADARFQLQDLPERSIPGRTA